MTIMAKGSTREYVTNSRAKFEPTAVIKDLKYRPLAKVFFATETAEKKRVLRAFSQSLCALCG